MIPAHVVQITTPKKYILNGLWLGPKKPKRVVVWVHGLGSSMFSKLSLAKKIADARTAALVFNNRGSERVIQIRNTHDTKSKRLLAGAAHERFTDCVDDIQGAINFAKRAGIKDIFLAGHSTGCQKSVYWGAKKGRGVKGIVLLAPVSDYAGALHTHGKAKVTRVAAYAQSLVRKGKPNELIPTSMWPEELDDAQRFLSLYTPASTEEIFCYAQPNKKPRTLQKVKVPTLILWAENDQFSDRPAKDAAAWFERNLKNKHKVLVVPKVGHSFKGGEKAVVRAVRDFMKEC